MKVGMWLQTPDATCFKPHHLRLAAAGDARAGGSCVSAARPGWPWMPTATLKGLASGGALGSKDSIQIGAGSARLLPGAPPAWMAPSLVVLTPTMR